MEKGKEREHYVNREHVVVERVPIQSANVRYIQVSVKNKQNKFRSDILDPRYHQKFACGEKEIFGRVAGRE